MLVDHGHYVGDAAAGGLKVSFSSPFPSVPKMLLVITDASAFGASYIRTPEMPAGQAVRALVNVGSARLETGQITTVEKGYFRVSGTLNTLGDDFWFLAFGDDGSGREVVSWIFDGELDNPGAYDIRGWNARIPWTRGARQRPSWGWFGPPDTASDLMFGEGLPLSGTGFTCASTFNTNTFAFQGRFAGGIKLVGPQTYVGARRYCWAIAESDDEAAFAFRPFTGDQNIPFMLPQTNPAPFTPTGFFRKLFATGTPLNNCLYWQLAWDDAGVAREAALSRSGCGNNANVTNILPIFGGYRVTAATNGLSTASDDGHGGIAYLWRKTQ